MARKKTKKTNIKSPKRRKGILAIALPWLKRFGAALAAIIVIIWIAAWLIATGAINRAAEWGQNQILTHTANAGFRIEKMLVEGRKNTDPNLLKAIINVQTGDPLFSLSPKQAKHLLEETKWIEFAHVQRRLPDTLYIKVIERTPMAIYKDNNGRTHLLDTRGNPIENEDTAKFNQLITISGDNSDTSSPAFIATLLKSPIIYERTIAAQRLGNRRWDIQIKNNAGNVITLKMPENDNLPLALTRISDAQKHDNILERPAVDSIDLRFDDKIIVRTKPGQVLDYQEGISNNERGI